MSKWMAKRSTGAEVITTPSNTTEQWLVQTVKRHAQQANIGMPEVAIFHSPEMNAFATGANKNNALVAVSSGLLDNMTQAEAEEVKFALRDLVFSLHDPDAQLQAKLDRHWFPCTPRI